MKAKDEKELNHPHELLFRAPYIFDIKVANMQNVRYFQILHKSAGITTILNPQQESNI